MTRWCAVALSTIGLIVLLTPPRGLQAQSGTGVPTRVPVDFTGGKAGLQIELFINNGKVADATVSGQGTASAFLDFSNLGKVEVHIYVDECQDGKTVKVMVQPGQTAEDNGCKRRFVGAPWSTVCGVTRITIDLRSWGAHVVGCGNFFTEPRGILTLVGIGGGGLIAGLAAGGGAQQTPFVTTPVTTAPSTTPTVSTPPTVTVTPVTPTPTNTSTPVPPPATPTPFTFDIQNFFATYEHTNPGVSSTVCGSFLLSPVVAGAPWTVQTVGTGASQPTVTGTTNASGVGIYRSIITQFNNFTINLSVTANGVTKTASTTVNVVGAAASRPCP